VYQCGGCGATLLRGKNPSPDRNDDAERNAVPPAVVRVNNLPRATRDDELPDASSTIIEATRSSARGEPAAAPKSAAESKPSRRDAAAGGGKVRRSVDDAATPTPPAASRKKAEQDLEKILNTVHALKGVAKSPGLDPTERPRPPRLPMRQGGHHASRPVKHGHQVAAAAPPRGLPSRRYRRCRADLPCCDNNAKRASCGCCGHHHGKPECGGPARAHEPPLSAPRHHCRPVLKGAPFIICSTCFTLVQVPAGFAASTDALPRRLRCGSCNAVLSYSYRDPAREKSSSFSAEDEPLHVSRNDTLDGVRGEGRLHRLMGHGSPDLYDDRTTPDYHRKGKSVCIDDDHEDGGVLKRSPKRGTVWPLPGMPGKAPGAIRIKS
jgi:hypothetical protein